MLALLLGSGVSDYGIPKVTILILGIRQGWSIAEIEIAQASL